MLLLLLLISAVTQVPALSLFSVARCPIRYFGETYDSILVTMIGQQSALCMKNRGKSSPNNDCLVFNYPLSGISVRLFTAQMRPGSAYHKNLPQLIGTSPCTVKVNFGYSHQMYFRAFEAQSVVNVRTNTRGRYLANGQSMGTFRSGFTDTSGCRHSGVLYKHNTVSTLQDGTVVTCDKKAVLHITPPPTDLPPADTDTICAVTGSTVIDVSGNTTSIQDRCAYTLLSDSDVRVVGHFQERRRKDVIFLDHVVLRLHSPGASIHLGQGGRVLLDDKELSLGSSPLRRHGVELRRDRTGVTAVMMHTNYTTTVFFDGYAAQIHMRGPIGATVQGLCGNASSPLGDVKLPKSSSRSCERRYKDSPDRTINCTAVTQHCSFLRQADFRACHSLVDPEPYISACTNTLCSYPMVDGLKCQFLEAYAKACSLMKNDTLEDWRSNASCPSPQAFCQGTLCSAHEFCAEDVNGGTSCLCRPIFASKYRSQDSVGELAVCTENSASVSLVGCLLEEKGFHYTDLHLNDDSCTGQMDNKTHMVTFGFDNDKPCGTVVTANNSHVIYKNTIMKENTSALITRLDQFKIDFSCFYRQPDDMAVAFRIKDNSVITEVVSGSWNYTLTMKAFTDADHTQAVSSKTEIALDQRIYMELKTGGLDGKSVALVIDSCWATSKQSASASPKYNLISNSCPNSADQTVKVEANGVGTSGYFSFDMFHFSGSSRDVYLHCKLSLCLKQKKSCVPSCGKSKRVRRSAGSEDGEVEGEGPAFISMAWVN